MSGVVYKVLVPDSLALDGFKSPKGEGRAYCGILGTYGGRHPCALQVPTCSYLYLLVPTCTDLYLYLP